MLKSVARWMFTRTFYQYWYALLERSRTAESTLVTEFSDFQWSSPNGQKRRIHQNHFINDQKFYLNDASPAHSRCADQTPSLFDFLCTTQIWRIVCFKSYASMRIASIAIRSPVNHRNHWEIIDHAPNQTDKTRSTQWASWEKSHRREFERHSAGQAKREDREVTNRGNDYRAFTASELLTEFQSLKGDRRPAVRESLRFGNFGNLGREAIRR